MSGSDIVILCISVALTALLTVLGYLAKQILDLKVDNARLSTNQVQVIQNQIATSKAVDKQFDTVEELEDAVTQLHGLTGRLYDRMEEFDKFRRQMREETERGT